MYNLIKNISITFFRIWPLCCGFHCFKFKWWILLLFRGFYISKFWKEVVQYFINRMWHGFSFRNWTRLLSGKVWLDSCIYHLPFDVISHSVRRHGLDLWTSHHFFENLQFLIFILELFVCLVQLFLHGGTHISYKVPITLFKCIVVLFQDQHIFMFVQ